MAECDNLEYYIKFPSSSHNYAPNGNDTDYVFVVDEEKIPVILLFGWAGCKDRYLAKYSQIYEDKGLITLRYTAPVKCLFWKRLQMRTIGEKLTKLLIDLNFDTHPIIVHCFSNGGAFLYQNFIAALPLAPKPLQIRGTIFDSSPGKRRILTLYRAVSAIIGGGKFYNFGASVLMTMLLSLFWLYEQARNVFNPLSFQSNPAVNLLNEDSRWPQHFIYSKADNLIPYDDVESFAAYRAGLGVDVSKLRYETSPHVKHYTENKESYTKSVLGFLQKCLNGN